MDAKGAFDFAQQRIEELRRLLSEIEPRRKFLNQRERELGEALTRWEAITEDLAKETEHHERDEPIDLTGMRLSDACFHLLKGIGRGLHARDIVVELRKRGRSINAKNPMDSVNKMLQRDRRFYRPGGRGSYWELEEGQESYWDGDNK